MVGTNMLKAATPWQSAYTTRFVKGLNIIA
jgi:hypothetical protein